MDFLNCDNLTSFKSFFALVMVRGKRRVFVGFFPYRNRAEKIGSDLDWEGFHSEITETQTPGQFVVVQA